MLDERDRLQAHASENGHAERAREDLWAESVRKYNRARREEYRSAWSTYHADQAARHRRTLEELIRYHEDRAQELMTDGQEEDV
jgi:hypothetical protein